MATINATRDTFEDLVVGNDIVLVDFWAEWCGPCKMFGPIFERVSEKHPDVTFLKVDTEAEQELAGYFGIRSIPTLMVFRDKVGVFSQPGALPEEVLEDLISQVRDLDMEAIHEEVASQQVAGSPQQH
jgi:thioredoxin 1